MMDARRQKAHELADRARIFIKDGFYHVPSQSHGGWYKVLLEGREALCECPDFELRDAPCKHIMAARRFVSREARGAEQDLSDVTPAAKVKRPTYPQRWDTYNQ
jgi:hypothetical protein